MKIFTGKVIAKTMAKTATVEVVRIAIHPLYKKRVKKVRKYHVHDEVGVGVGKTVRFAASKPFSKLKHWVILPDVSKKGEKQKGAKPSSEKL